MTNLTAKQIQIIKDTWEVPKKDLEGSGEAILYRYFEKYPHNQQKFAAFKNLPLESLKVSFLPLHWGNSNTSGDRINVGVRQYLTLGDKEATLSLLKYVLVHHEKCLEWFQHKTCLLLIDPGCTS